MNIEGLNPERVYKAIEDGVKAALMEMARNTYSMSVSGDRLMKAVENGARDAIATQMIGVNVQKAIEDGSRRAVSGTY